MKKSGMPRAGSMRSGCVEAVADWLERFGAERAALAPPAKNWPTPRAHGRDGPGNMTFTESGRSIRKSGQTFSVPLSVLVRMEDPTKKLNPVWAEQIMGFPVRWSLSSEARAPR